MPHEEWRITFSCPYFSSVEEIARGAENTERAVFSPRKIKASGATLIIEPRVRELKFVGGGTRFFAGTFAGSSAVRMTVKMIDKESGTVIAEPEFYQNASAFTGSFSIGATDNMMLDQISTVVQAYMERNYTQAVGGSTGYGGERL